VTSTSNAAACIIRYIKEFLEQDTDTLHQTLNWPLVTLERQAIDHSIL
jgi:hypothetical protein